MSDSLRPHQSQQMSDRERQILHGFLQYVESNNNNKTTELIDTNGRFVVARSTRNGRDKEKVARIDRRTVQKSLNDLNYHKAVVTHLETDILVREVKWALGSITTNKASESDGIPVELFQIPKDDAVKVLHSMCQEIWKTQQWPQD